VLGYVAGVQSRSGSNVIFEPSIDAALKALALSTPTTVAREGFRSVVDDFVTTTNLASPPEP
jgi:hypothetical protein